MSHRECIEQELIDLAASIVIRPPEATRQRSENWLVSAQPIFVERDRFDLVVQLEPGPDSAGQDPEGWRVVLYPSNQDADSPAAHRDSTSVRGQVLFEGLPPGEYRLEILSGR